MPESMTDAVHSLMQQFSLNARIHTSFCTPVSKVVLNKAYTKCGDELTAAIERVARMTKNGCFFGWASELKQKDILRSVLKANLATHEANSSRKRTKGNRANVLKGVENSKLAFFPVAEADFVRTFLIVKGGGNLVSGSVIWCTNLDQEFDVAFYFENTLVTLKFVTGADDHLLRLEHVKPLRTAIINMGGHVEKIVHLCIATKDNNEGKFKFSDPTDVKRVMTRADALADAAWSSEAGTCSPFQQRRQQGVIISFVVKKQLAQTIEWLRSKIKACKWWREKRKSSWTQEVIMPAAADAPTFIVAVDATSALEKTTRTEKNGVFLGDDAKFYEISNAFSKPVGLDKSIEFTE